MKRADLLKFMSGTKYAVETSAGREGPEGAVVRVVFRESFEIVFDMLATTRKALNLRRNPRRALVIGGTGNNDVRTVQVSGIADEPTGAELGRLKAICLACFPDGLNTETWTGII